MADRHCRHCRGKGYYYINEDDMEICECDEQEEEYKCRYCGTETDKSCVCDDCERGEEE